MVSIFSEDKDVQLDISKVEESAKKTEEKTCSCDFRLYPWDKPNYLPTEH